MLGMTHGTEANTFTYYNDEAHGTTENIRIRDNVSPEYYNSDADEIRSLGSTHNRHQMTTSFSLSLLNTHTNEKPSTNEMIASTF